jgi:hypothetical protein
LDGMPWGFFRLDATGANGPQTLCIPDFAQGAVHSVMFATFGGVAELSNFEIVTDSRCGAGALDRGFERVLTTGSWNENSPGLSRTQVSGRSNVLLIPATESGVIQALVRVPEPLPPAEGHAAFEFAHRLDTNGTGTYSIDGFGNALTNSFSAPDWATDTRCIPRVFEGQLVAPTLTISGRRSSSPANTIDQRVWIDDAGPVLSTSCR